MRIEPRGPEVALANGRTSRADGEAAALVEFRSWLATQPADHWSTFQRHFPIAERSVNSREWERALGAAGWLGVSWPIEYGGRGLSLTAALRFAQELAAAGAPEIFNITGLELVGPAVLRFGTEEQKLQVLPALLAGQIWCQGFSEPDAGSDLANIRTMARPEGDTFVINGQKVWSTNSPAASGCILLARTDPDAPLHRGITCFLVPMDLPGVEVRPIAQVTGDSDFSELFFTDVVVGANMVLGEVNGGWRVASEVLVGERAKMFSILGTVHADMVEALAAVAALPMAAPGTVLLRHRAVDVAVEERVVQWCNDNVVENLAAERPDARLESTMKVAWSEVHQRIVQLGADTPGLDGLLEADDPDTRNRGKWLYALMHGRAETIYAGTSEIQRNIIAERVLGLPREPRGDDR
jgi:alkylation response protein AidB-like acyl-CoA dehydrogenase